MKTHTKYDKKSSLSLENIPAKKKMFGQHFLRKQSVVDHMVEKVSITPSTSVLEIGCGDGFLTQAILQQSSCKELRCYEIDQEWADFTRNKITDTRLTIVHENILDFDPKEIKERKPWVILANLPYQITFPIFKLFVRNKELFQEGVVMIQEEVAQKIVAKSGRSFGAMSIYLQHHFELSLMDKIEPGAFTPPPKVFSRLIYFKPRAQTEHIENIEDFWHFIRLLFQMPRRTLRNNLKSTHFDISSVDEELLNLRAQQIDTKTLINLWHQLLKTGEGAKS